MSVRIDFNDFFDVTLKKYNRRLYKALSRSAKINIKNQFKVENIKELNWKIIESFLKHKSYEFERDLTPKFIKSIQNKFEIWDYDDESLWIEEEIDEMIYNLIGWCKDNYSTPQQIKDENNRYAREYDEKHYKPRRLRRSQAIANKQAKRRKDSKELVLDVANSLKSKDLKITIANIHIAMATKEKILSKPRIGVYLKELREENKV